MKEFKELSLYTRLWFLCCAVAYENRKAEELIKRYIPDATMRNIHHIETAVDDAIYLPTEHANYLAFKGTKNNLAWLNNALAFTVGGFHYGWKSQFDKRYKEKVIDLSRDAAPFYITGHSRGGVMALLANKAIIESGCRKQVESITFASPRLVNSKGAAILTALKLNHTHVYSDSNCALKSDLVDDTGARNGMEFGGCKINLSGSAGPFDHSYRQITLLLILKMLLWHKSDDADFLKQMMDEGVPIK